MRSLRAAFCSNVKKISRDFMHFSQKMGRQESIGIYFFEPLDF